MNPNTLKFINQLEGFKTRTKALHWDAKNKAIHDLLDELHKELSDYSDRLAEIALGLDNTMFDGMMVEPKMPAASTAAALIIELRLACKDFYRTIPDNIDYVAIKADCESFLSTLSKYTYLINQVVMGRAYDFNEH